MQVFCVHSEPNYSLPWQRKRQYSSTSSGFIISGRRILTNAHSVDHHCQASTATSGHGYVNAVETYLQPRVEERRKYGRGDRGGDIGFRV